MRAFAFNVGSQIPKAHLQIAGISDCATVVIAIASVLSFLVVKSQANSMTRQTRIANEQSKKTNEIIDIELRRDRQANLISAWIRTDLNAATNSNPISVQALIWNASKQPIYDVEFKIFFIRAGSKVHLRNALPIKEEKISTIPPSEEPVYVWQLAGFKEGVGTVAQIREPFSQESWELSRTLLSGAGLLVSDLYQISIEIKFRGADESEWVRSDTGFLTQIKKARDSIVEGEDFGSGKQFRWNWFLDWLSP